MKITNNLLSFLKLMSGEELTNNQDNSITKKAW